MPLPMPPRRDEQFRRLAILTDRQVETMLAILIRNLEAFEIARDQLTPRDFAPHHRLYGIIWRVVLDHHAETGELPLEEYVTGEVERRVRSDTSALSDEEVAIADDFIVRAYYAPLSQLSARTGILHLKSYLSQRLAANLRRDIGSGADAPQDMFGLLTSYTQQADTVRSLAALDLAEPFPEDWTVAPEVFVTQQTGLHFFDQMLGGGLGRGEVTGILGPYGSAKTTLGIQISTGMATLAAGRHDGNNETPLDFCYYFFWEGTLDQVRLRALSCAGRLNRELMAAANLHLLRGDDRPLNPYERLLFGAELATGALVPSEQARLAQARCTLNRNWRCICMNGSDRTNPGGGAGLVDEIVSRMRAEDHQHRSRGLNPRVGVIVIDYVGAAVRRHCDAKGLDPIKYTRLLIKEFVDQSAHKLAIPLNCSVVLLHQLSGAANDARPGSVARGSDAAECKSFEENLDFGFVLGKPGPNHVSAIRCSKHRRTGGCEPEVMKISSHVARVDPAGDQYSFDSGANKIIDRRETGLVSQPPPATIPMSRRRTPFQRTM